MKNNKIFSIPKSAWIILLITNAVFAWWIDSKIGSYIGWTVVDLSNDLSINLPTILAVLQFVLFALTLDMLMRLIVVSVNQKLTKSQIPSVFVNAMSVAIYGIVGLTGFILLYDHSLSHILATGGALGVGAFVIFRDWIADVSASIQIQLDHLVRINDYIQVSGEKNLYKVKQIDHRMVTLEDDHSYLIRIPTRQFLNWKYINLSLQPTERGVRRRCVFNITSANKSTRVLECMDTAMKYLIANDKRFNPNYSCQIQQIEGGAIGYGIRYECDLSLTPNASNNLIFIRLLHIFNAAAINLNSDMEITPTSANVSEAQQRLMDVYRSSVLKVLDESQAEKLSSAVKIIRFESGEQLIRKGEHAESMYFISEGHLEVRIPGKDDQEKVVATLWPGDCVGEMSLLTGEPRSANVFAKSKGILLEITKDSLTPLFEESPILIDKLSKILTDRKVTNEKAFLTIEDQKENINQIKALAQKIFKFFLGSK